MTPHRDTTPPPAFIRVAYHTPRQAVLITTRYKSAQNVWPIDWHIPLSLDPELYGISLNRSGYGTELIRQSGLFVVNFVPMAWEQAILYCGRTSGREIDKFSAANLRKEEAVSVDAPRVAGALGYLECRVSQTVEVGDHTLFIGAVTHRELRAEAPRLHHLDHSLSDRLDTFK